jgi:tRNA U34 5-methylaminomethyl-2-thiouridine-forming methyltransferase MnmC
MRRELIVTKDGSASISVPELNVTYHSIHGAIAESKHVFIEAGLRHVLPNIPESQVNIFEMGFGTGLNAFLTLLESESQGIRIYYETVETNPLHAPEYLALDYAKILAPAKKATFIGMHECRWEEEVNISPLFVLKKRLTSLLSFVSPVKFDLIYFDAFAPLAQPELWTKEVFEHLYATLREGGCLLTYCAKGDVRRAMMAAGFIVEKLKGPPGKREMLRAGRGEE